MGCALGGSEFDCSPAIEAFGLLTTVSELLRKHRVGIKDARGWSSIVCECDGTVYSRVHHSGAHPRVNRPIAPTLTHDGRPPPCILDADPMLPQEFRRGREKAECLDNGAATRLRAAECIARSPKLF